MLTEIAAKFEALYQQKPLLIRSPGRVNLIGEHTDYNNGFVLPAAINKEIYFALAPNGTDHLRAYAFNLHESTTFDLHDISRSDITWANYLLGVVVQLQQAGCKVQGFRGG